MHHTSDYLKQSFVIQIGGPLVVSDWQIHGFVFWTGLSENYHFCAKHLGMLSSCIVVFRGGRAQFLKVVYNSTLLILSWFLWQTFGGVIRLDCCLREGGSDKAPRLSIRIVIWILPSDTCAWYLCYILDSVLIFVPHIWGNYQVRLLSLSPVGPWGGEGTFSEMCVQFNILDFILIFVPNTWGSFGVPEK